MNKIKLLIERAKKDPRKIAFPESDDERILEAVRRIRNERIADVLLLNERTSAGKYSELAAEKFYEIKKHKGITKEDAKSAVKDPLCMAAVLTRIGLVDGFVAGAMRTTRDVVRTAINCLEIDRSQAVVSGAFLMEVSSPFLGASGLFVFSDCAVIPEPSAKQLARAAISAGELLEKLFQIQPKIALLTYSSKGSADGESIDRAKEAVEMVKEKRPDFIVDGELQIDSAVIPEIAKRKCPDSVIKGDANVLIFPNLDAGNIAYKAIERFAGATAVGPALLGFTRPVSDLSRGCGAEDIVNATALTVVRAQLTKDEGR